MAHFAELDEKNVVIRVIVVANEDCLDENGDESEVVGAMFCQNLLGGRWVQTSYNGSIRKQYAGFGYTYDPDADVFIAPQPFPSWTLDESHDWQPPIPMPSEGRWYWDDEQDSWIEITE